MKKNNDNDKDVNLENNKDRDRFYKKMSDEQKVFFESIKDNTFTFCEATAGSGKTVVAVSSMLDLLASNKINKIIYIQKVSQRYLCHGYLPGSLEEKTDALWTPFYDAMATLGFQEEAVDRMIDNGLIILTSDSNLRGVNFEKAAVCIDECIDEKSLIVTDDGAYTIGTLFSMKKTHQKLPKVLTINEITQELAYKSIKDIVYKGDKETRFIKFYNKSLRCTDNHPILTPTGWKRADELNVGDVVCISDKVYNYKYTSIIGIDNDRKIVPVYDMEVKGNHNFCITSEDDEENGIFVHNCQNCDTETLRLILTRCHDNCHVVMIGDSLQKDNRGNKTSDFVEYGRYLANSDLGNECKLTKNFRGKFSQLAESFIARKEKRE